MDTCFLSFQFSLFSYTFYINQYKLFWIFFYHSLNLHSSSNCCSMMQSVFQFYGFHMSFQQDIHFMHAITLCLLLIYIMFLKAIVVYLKVYLNVLGFKSMFLVRENMFLIVRPIECVPLLLISQHMDTLTHSLYRDNCLYV